MELLLGFSFSVEGLRKERGSPSYLRHQTIIKLVLPEWDDTKIAVVMVGRGL